MPVCIYVHICLSLISVYICLVTYIYIYEKIWPKGLKLIAENKPSEQGKTKLQKAPSCNQEQKQWTCRVPAGSAHLLILRGKPWVLWAADLTFTHIH